MAEELSTGWTFLTNHGHVLAALYRNGDLRQRDIAELVGITEGAVQRILTELQESDYVQIEKCGRRNRYVVNADRPFRHRLESGHSVGEMLDVIAWKQE